MVAADFALLSFAVLSTIGFGTVRGEGRYARFRQRLADRDESDITYGTLDVATESVTSIPVLTSTPKPPPRGPVRPTSDAGNTPVTVSLDLGHSTSPIQEGQSEASSSDLSSSSDLTSSLSLSADPTTSQDVESLSAATDTTYNTLQTDTGSVTSTPTVGPTVRPPGRPPGRSTSSVPAAPVTISLDLGHPADNTLLSVASQTVYNTLQTVTDSVTSTPTVAPTVRPPVRPGQSTSVVVAAPATTLDFGHDTASSSAVDSDASTSTIGVKATYLNSDSASSSTSVSYIDPEQYGAGGTLTTDSNVFTRTAEPSRTSVIPNSSSRIGPPPADTSVLTSSKKPPVLPTLAESTPDVVADPTSTPSDGLSYLPGPIVGTASLSNTPTTKPTGLPVRPTLKSSFTRTSEFTLDFGHTPPPETDDGATPTSSTDTPAVTPSTWPYSNSTWGNTTLSSVTSTLYPWSYTISESLTTDERGSTGTVCMPTDALKPSTTYSVIYTSTITWYGNPDDYTPPYAPISTPDPCIPPKSPLRFTMSYCTATGTATGSDISKYQSCITSTVSLVYTTAAPGFSNEAPTITFVTTDKNPTVVFSSIETPDYGVSQPAGTRDQVEHTSAAVSPDPRTTPEYQSQVTGNAGQGGSNPGSSVNNGGANANSPGATGNNGGAGGAQPGATANNPGHAPAQTPITVGVQPTAVVVNGQTITDNPQAPTQVVTVGGQEVTINPTQVVVAGQTVTRPAATGGVFVPTPTTTQIQGVPVTVSSSIAIIGRTSFTLGPTPTTTVVNGQPVTIGPSGVVVASTTIPVVSVPSPTQVVVEGGDLITAIGPSVVVIHGTTLTYGPDKPASTTVVDDDTITIGPSGVIVHGTTIGGPSARSSETQYEIVGGATITQIGPSVIVINNATYTVGPGTGTTTTVVGGETVTIGPSGVAAGTHSITYPFGPTTTITPKATGVVATASPTASKDAGLALRPDTWVSFVCIAIGVVGFAL